MQNKSAIWVFTILLSLACLYQLSFSVLTGMHEGNAEEYAENKIDSVISAEGEMSQYVQDSTYIAYQDEWLAKHANDEIYPILGFTYKEAKKSEINLGLDLQGGMNVTLEVSVVDLIKALSGNSDDPAFVQALADATEMQKASQDDFVSLFGEAFQKNAPDQKLAAIFHNRENQDKFPREASNEEILEIIREEAVDAIKRTEQVLRKRIDNLGVVQPTIQRLSSSDRIIVELPGIKDKKRVRKILQGTARLDFWETYDNKEVFSALDQANNLLKEIEGAKNKKSAKAEGDTTKVDESATPTEEEGLAELFAEEKDSTDDASSDLLSELAGDSASVDSATQQAQMIDDFNKNNPLFAILKPALLQDPNTQQYYPGDGPVVGFAALTDVAKINEYLERKDVKNLLPPRIKFFWSAKPYDENGEYVQLFAIKVTNRDGKAPLEGDVVTNARVETDPLGNPEVSLIMNPTGAQKWRLITKENVGKSVAIVLDGFVYSAPTVNGEIKGGISSIQGRFTPDEAEDLANVLKAGKLPAPANIIEEAVVGPSLGQEAISSGLSSFVIALILILLYMAFYYSTAGIVADIALIANVFFVMGVLTSLGATLTLPGIAGIVLTIGMSVDANVLIYERIREEVASGKGLKLAIVDGYNNAYSSIIDANITTLLTGIVLAVFGTGPIKGFATTLIIGILTSLFSAIFITRLIFEWQLNKNGNLKFASKFSEGAFKNINIGFINKRKLYYTISSVVILIGIASFAVRGLNYGVDFTGGRSYLVRFDNPAKLDQVRTELGNVFVDENGLRQVPEVKTFGSSNQVKITTKYLIGDASDGVEELVEIKLNDGLTAIGDTYEVMSSQKVEATIADDIKQSAIWAVLFALVVIFFYIVLRFQKWQFGLGALAAMFHDVLIVLAIFSIFYGILPFSLEIDQAFIAAILTVVGYSINDTVVVFDRIREYLGLHKKKQYQDVVNDALNSTLSRTINTSLSTFVVLLMIFLFGGEVIRGFVFALMVGVVVGTYSSLCVATPIVVDLVKRQVSKK
jgi:SecD/SecF fusion protein